MDTTDREAMSGQNLEHRIVSWVTGHAGGAVEAIVPVGGGMGDTALWRVRISGRDGDLGVRMFARGAERQARREVVAMRAAKAHGVPVPEVLVHDVLNGQPVVLLTWSAGAPAAGLLQASSVAGAREVGLQLGQTLGAINAIPAPAGHAAEIDWFARGGPAIAHLESGFRALPAADRLLHLDFHPLNVLMTPGRVTGVIDWANTLSGPPHIDLARALAILRAAMLGVPAFAEVGELFRAYGEGLTAGHASIVGPDPHPARSAVWAAAMTVDDLSAHVGKAGSWVTDEMLEVLRGERDELIAAVSS